MRQEFQDNLSTGYLEKEQLPAENINWGISLKFSIIPIMEVRRDEVEQFIEVIEASEEKQKTVHLSYGEHRNDR